MRAHTSVPSLGLCGLAFAAALSFACGGPPPPSAPSALLGKPLPDFHRDALSGERVDTAKLRGKVTVVKFFAKYCAPCKKTLPAVQAFHERHPDVAIVGVSEDERAADAQELVSTYHLTFPVVMDSGNALSGRYRANVLPATFVIDSHGVVRWVGNGDHTDDDLVRAIAATN